MIFCAFFVFTGAVLGPFFLEKRDLFLSAWLLIRKTNNRNFFKTKLF
ncbi:hypothetical protein HMPREF1869_00022 [Bacteroidales bacterium KA00251]|nr:hypothetical protein HMPREF1869_00022 [Bacteroidales bacterium KA00251]